MAGAARQPWRPPAPYRPAASPSTACRSRTAQRDRLGRAALVGHQAALPGVPEQPAARRPRERRRQARSRREPRTVVTRPLAVSISATRGTPAERRRGNRQQRAVRATALPGTPRGRTSPAGGGTRSPRPVARWVIAYRPAAVWEAPGHPLAAGRQREGPPLAPEDASSTPGLQATRPPRAARASSRPRSRAAIRRDAGHAVRVLGASMAPSTVDLVQAPEPPHIAAARRPWPARPVPGAREGITSWAVPSPSRVRRRASPDRARTRSSRAE